MSSLGDFELDELEDVDTMVSGPAPGRGSPLLNPHVRRGNRNTMSDADVFTNVYVLGVGILACLYALHFNNFLCSISFLAAQWVSCFSHFLYDKVFSYCAGRTFKRWLRHMRAKFSESTNDYVVLPLLLLFSATAIALHTAHAWTWKLEDEMARTPPNIALAQVAMSTFGPAALAFIRAERPRGVVRVMEIASPMSGTLATVVLVAIFLNPIQQTACIFNRYIKADSVIDDLKDYAMHFHTSAIACIVFMPFAGACLLATLISATNSGSTFDILLGALSISILSMYSATLPPERKYGETLGKLGIFFLVGAVILNTIHTEGKSSLITRKNAAVRL